MTRPVQPLGTYGQIAVKKTGPGRFVASARYRDDDGRHVRITSTDSTSQLAVNALKAKIADHVSDGEQGDLHRNTLLSELAEFLLAEVNRPCFQAGDYLVNGVSGVFGS